VGLSPLSELTDHLMITKLYLFRLIPNNKYTNLLTSEKSKLLITTNVCDKIILLEVWVIVLEVSPPFRKESLPR
jgi:hypothetical protein